MQKYIDEVRSDYYCDEEKCTYIDAWYHGNEEGFSVAKVYNDGRIEWTDKGEAERLYENKRVIEEIARVKETRKFFALLFNDEGVMVEKCVVNKPKDYLEKLIERWGYDGLSIEEIFTERTSPIAEIAYDTENDDEVYFFAI